MDDQWLWWAFLFAFLIAWLWSRKINRDIQQMESDIKKVLNKILFMRVEKHNELFLAYNAFNDEFICQGITMDELNANFGKRYPGYKGVIVEPDKEAA